jgi:hypothetical protein
MKASHDSHFHTYGCLCSAAVPAWHHHCLRPLFPDHLFVRTRNKFSSVIMFAIVDLVANVPLATQLLQSTILQSTIKDLKVNVHASTTTHEHVITSYCL